MANKAILVSFIALFALVLTLAPVLAVDTCDASAVADITYVEIDGIDAYSSTAAAQVSDKIPVEVEFEANADAEDVRISAFVEGYKNEIYYSTSRFHIVAGSTYKKRFVLEVPSTFDLDDLNEDLTLNIRISAKGADSCEKSYTVNVQRELYSLQFLSVDSASEVLAGDTFAVDVVLENNGVERLDRTFVKVSIPELGISQQVYIDDLKPVEEYDYDQIRNTVNKRVYLSVPKSAKPGVYDLEVEAYNYDASVTTQKKVVVNDAQAGIIPARSTKTIAPSEETTFDVVLVNTNDRILVYSIVPEESAGLIVDVTEPVVAVPGESSRTVKIKVKATDSAEEGTHVVTVNVNSESGVSEPVKFTVNVEKNGASVTGGNAPDTVVILTVVLAIIFVVLLIVLIVLLTKRPAEPEEFGETSYY